MDAKRKLAYIKKEHDDDTTRSPPNKRPFNEQVFNGMGVSVEFLEDLCGREKSDQERKEFETMVYSCKSYIETQRACISGSDPTGITSSDLFKLTNEYHGLFKNQLLSKCLAKLHIHPLLNGLSNVSKGKHPEIPKFTKFEGDIIKIITEHVSVTGHEIDLAKSLFDLVGWLDNLFWLYTTIPTIWFSDKILGMFALIYIAQLLYREYSKVYYKIDCPIKDMPYYITGLLFDLYCVTLPKLHGGTTLGSNLEPLAEVINNSTVLGECVINYYK